MYITFQPLTNHQLGLILSKKSESLGLRSPDLVLDHAIYAKALEVMNIPALRHLKNYINLRMGGFHACGLFIAIISKRFGCAGLKDIMIETKLIRPSSDDAVLRGLSFNNQNL